jgi:hypothetical protein
VALNIIVKKGFKLIGVHLLGLALALFYIFIFGWVIQKWGFVPYSVIAGLSYVGLMYSEGWNWGRKEGRKYSEVKESPLRALAASAIPFAVCVVLAALVHFGFQVDIMNFIAKIWYFPFVGFYREQEIITSTEILLTGLLVPAVVTFSYFTGTKNFSVIDKIAYRKNRAKMAERQENANKNKTP